MKKTFDCVAMKRKGSLKIYELLKNMTLEKELMYWQERTEVLRKNQTRLVGMNKEIIRPGLQIKTTHAKEGKMKTTWMAFLLMTIMITPVYWGYNLSWNCTDTTPPPNAEPGTDIIANPLFINNNPNDILNSDFHLQAGSPAINVGRPDA